MVDGSGNEISIRLANLSLEPVLLPAGVVVAHLSSMVDEDWDMRDELFTPEILNPLNHKDVDLFKHLDLSATKLNAEELKQLKRKCLKYANLFSKDS